MNKFTFQTLILLFIFISCSKEVEEDNFNIKEGNGTVWLSGGLYFCAEQIRMDNGDTLIPVINPPEIFLSAMNGRVHIKYKVIDNRVSGCTIGKDCEIIEINEIE